MGHYPRYIVSGHVMEYIADFHCEAVDKSEALEKWKKAFPNCPVDTFSPEVFLVEGDPVEEAQYCYDGYRYYSGGYRYTH